MKFAVASLAALAAASMVVGCANKNNPKAAAANGANPSVTDIRPLSPAPAPVVVQPVQPVQPVIADNSPIVAAPTASATPTGGTYTVQKGDTLFKIARAKYGDPTAVRRIAAANPGLNANNIKAGQKINLP